MRLIKLLVGEFVLLFASILIFRSVWTLLDQYLGYDYLIVFLIGGIVLTIMGLYIIDYEVKCELQKKNHSNAEK
jgi:hypothetical protein